MKTENEEKREFDQDNEGAGHSETRHTSWLENGLGRINTEFPLSGGETEEDFDDEYGKDRDEDDEDDNITQREHLNSNFPLSGGDLPEVDV
jgi:hypothetical protein